MKHIVRTWTCWIKTEHIEFCRRYVEAGKIAEMRAAAGNLEARTIYRDLGDGSTAVVFLSLWDSWASVERFAVDGLSKPTGQGNRGEDHMTLDREAVVRHHEVDAGDPTSLRDWF